MKNILVGYTGFVGSNILSEAENEFDGLYNSKNIEDAYGTNPDLLVYSGVPAQKFLANKFPQKDMEIIENAIFNIKKINPKKLVLISTIDVYPSPVDVSEDSEIIVGTNQPYGEDRYYLERWVMDNFNDYLIVRLPGLYGKNIKKNFIYDFINVVPSMLKIEKMEEIGNNDEFIMKYYRKEENGFYKLIENITDEEMNDLRRHFNAVGFSAVNFTDSRGKFQFYNLKYLWKHINIALDQNIKLLNLATEPVEISLLYKYLCEKEFKNELSGVVPNYNYVSKYASLFDGHDGYIFDKEFILDDIKKFVEVRK